MWVFYHWVGLNNDVFVEKGSAHWAFVDEDQARVTHAKVPGKKTAKSKKMNETGRKKCRKRIVQRPFPLPAGE